MFKTTYFLFYYILVFMLFNYICCVCMVETLYNGVLNSLFSDLMLTA